MPIQHTILRKPDEWSSDSPILSKEQLNSQNKTLTMTVPEDMAASVVDSGWSQSLCPAPSRKLQEANIPQNNPNYLVEQNYSLNQEKDLPGNLLPESVQRLFKRSFIPRVRIHTDPLAAKTARRLGAEAFTLGQNIYFGQNRFKPETSEGLGVLVHELTHVSQQQRLRRSFIEGKINQGQILDMEKGALNNETAFLRLSRHEKLSNENFGNVNSRQEHIKNSHLLNPKIQGSIDSEAGIVSLPLTLSITQTPIVQKAAEERGNAIIGMASETGSAYREPSQPTIDIKAVAKEVYRLLELKLEIEKERFGV
jgi:hypothetical protein